MKEIKDDGSVSELNIKPKFEVKCIKCGKMWPSFVEIKSQYTCIECQVVEPEINTEDKIKGMMRSAGFGMKFVNAKLEDYNVYNKKAENVLGECKQYLKEFDGVKGFFFWGQGKGTGKSYLSAAIARELIKKGIKVKRIHILDLLSSIRQAYNNDKFTEEEKINEFIGKNYLIIDDIGTEKNSPWVLEMLNRIINKRWEDELPLSATSNLSLEELSLKVDDRIGSRLAGMTRDFIIHFPGPDDTPNEEEHLDDYRIRKI